VIELTSLVQRIGDAKAGEAEVRRNLFGEFVSAIGEQGGIKIDRLHDARLDGAQPHGVTVEETGVN